MSQHFDYIIVGQGIAGTLLSHQLTKAEKKILVIDAFNPNSSSHVAAGIIHPITGRRLVKTWQYETAMKIALNVYKELESIINTTLFFEKPILEIFDSVKTKNDWILKSSDSNVGHIAGKIFNGQISSAINSPFGGIQINGGGFLLIKRLIEMYRQILFNNNSLLEEQFEIDLLKHHDRFVEYKSFTAEKIIFCEGSYAAVNKYFNHLPFQLAKGEVLVVKCDALTDDYIINKSNYILPLGNQHFKIGSTFDWENLNTQPTPQAREKLIHHFQTIVNPPFTVVEQFAAVRPTVKHRKPFLGFHPQYINIGIFNGLGTKGVLLAPWLSTMMCNLLTDEQPLIKEVEITNYH